MAGGSIIRKNKWALAIDTDCPLNVRSSNGLQGDPLQAVAKGYRAKGKAPTSPEPPMDQVPSVDSTLSSKVPSKESFKDRKSTN